MQQPPNQQPQPGYDPQQQPQQSYNAPGFQPPMATPQKKKSRKALWITLGVIIVLILACAGIAGGAGKTDATSTPSNTNNNQQTSSQPAPTTAPEKPTPTPKPLAWKTTHSFKGNGIKKTEVFTVGDTWKIVYSCQGMGSGIDGVLSVTVYGSDGSMQDVAVNATCKDGQTTKDESVEHQGGSIYLDVNASSDWTIDVQEQK